MKLIRRNEMINQKDNTTGKATGKALLCDCIILIFVLPAVYCLVSFQSVVHCLQISIDHITAKGTDANHTRFSCYSERKQFLQDRYAADVAVGDTMETVA